MIREDLLREIILDQQALIKPSPEYVEREAIKKVSPLLRLKHITVITGPRRAGKSVFLSQIINKFYGLDEVFYLNLDDERLFSLTVEDMQTVMDTFKYLFGRKGVIFLDEIQNLEGWERFISRLYNEGYKIFITGSNAKLLSSELSTHLTGRYMEIEIFPFSFREFLNFHHVRIIDKKELYKSDVKVKVRKLFDDFLQIGGFPEAVKYKEPEILRTLFSDVITKDVVLRYNIREVKTIKEIAHFLLINSANEFSYNRIKNIYSLGSIHTVKNYIGYLSSTYLFFELPRFSFSLKEMQTKVKKIYSIDNGFITSLSIGASRDIGKLYENLVFTELRRQKKEIFYYKDKNNKEVDFIVKEGSEVKECIQVCYDVSDQETLKREISSLLSCLEKFNLKKGLILTENVEDVQEVKGKRILFLPAYRWVVERKL